MKRTLIVLFTLLLNNFIYSQTSKRPKLVVGIVIDQMRAEYLYRFEQNFSNDGFKKLMGDGFTVKNMHYNYVPTVTGSGHASIYTGTFPSIHGIVGNNWYSKSFQKEIYCAGDNSVFLVDNEGASSQISEFSRSPKNMESSTITDELKLFTAEKSKVIGISVKDRGAILPAGHLANYAFWINRDNGNFITSTFYSNKLPKWLIDFNNKKLANTFLNQKWNTLLPIEKYTNSYPDDSPYEKIFKGRKNSTFPYNLKKLRKKNGNFKLIAEVPFGNTLITQMAKATIQGEQMGQDSTTDFLAISYSSTDYVGHNFGIRSKELEDTYVRLDRELAELLKYLDKTIGKNNYLVFLTADHAGSDYPKFLNDKKQSGGLYNNKQIQDTLNDCLSRKLHKKDIYVTYNNGLFAYLKDENKSKSLTYAKSCLKNIKGLKDVIIPSLDSDAMQNSQWNNLVKNTYHKNNSGDIYFIFEPGWMNRRNYGTSHSTGYSSDTHVPMLWYGWNIPKGYSVQSQNITDIAPTLSILLDIPIPNGSSHKIITPLFKK